MKEWIDRPRCPGHEARDHRVQLGQRRRASPARSPRPRCSAIFGREGVDLATRWVAPAAGSQVEDAFRLYLDYDGAGAQVAGDSVRATTSNVDAVGAYAVRDGGTLYVLLFNKDTAQRTVAVSVVGRSPACAPLPLHRHEPLAAAGSAPPAARPRLTLPARSATLAVTQLTTTPPPATQLHPDPVPSRRTCTTPAGSYAGPALSAGVPDVHPRGPLRHPGDRQAISLNVTVTAPTAVGNLALYPAGSSAGTATMTNYSAGQTRARARTRSSWWGPQPVWPCAATRPASGARHPRRERLLPVVGPSLLEIVPVDVKDEVHGPRRAVRTASEPVPSVASRATVLLARVWPVEKLMVVVGGGIPLPGNRLRKPAAVDPVTARFTEMAVAVDGMPHEPVRVNVRRDDVEERRAAQRPGRVASIHEPAGSHGVEAPRRRRREVEVAAAEGRRLPAALDDDIHDACRVGRGGGGDRRGVDDAHSRGRRSSERHRGRRGEAEAADRDRRPARGGASRSG